MGETGNSESRISALYLAAAILTCGLALAAEMPSVVVFDLESEQAEDGKTVASTLRAKLRRTKKVAMLEDSDLAEALGDFKAAYDKDDEVVKFATEQLAATIVCWGRVVHAGGVWEIKLKIAANSKVTTVEKKCDAYPQVSAFLTETAEALTGGKLFRPYESPPEKPSDAAKPNLLVNGDFEEGDKQPVGWDRPDGLSTFWVPGGPKPGKCIKIDTDIYLDEWKKWQEEAKSSTGPAPRKTPTTGNKYDTVAGTHGVHYYSDWLDVKPGTAYRLSVDCKGRAIYGGAVDFFAKVFVKGYDLFKDAQGREQWREVWNSYVACRTRTEGKQWEHFSKVFNPTERTPNVKRMRVILYAYWPPDVYFFDNVRLTEE